MLQLSNDITIAVANGEITIEEAKKFTEFLKHQRWQINEAERKRQDEERKKEKAW